jgi:hypothetical protein
MKKHLVYHCNHHLDHSHIYSVIENDNGEFFDWNDLELNIKGKKSRTIAERICYFLNSSEKAKIK